MYTVERNDVRIEGCVACNQIYIVTQIIIFLYPTGLPKFTDINVTVAARTSVGLGPASLPVSVKTNESRELYLQNVI